MRTNTRLCHVLFVTFHDPGPDTVCPFRAVATQPAGIDPNLGFWHGSSVHVPAARGNYTTCSIVQDFEPVVSRIVCHGLLALSNQRSVTLDCVGSHEDFPDHWVGIGPVVQLDNLGHIVRRRSSKLTRHDCFREPE